MSVLPKQYRGRIAGILWCICVCACSPITTTSDASMPPESCFAPQLGHPTIRKLTFIGTLPQQPQTLRFKIEWEDNQADLRGGSYQFFVDGEERTLLLLPDAWVTFGNAGTFELLLPLPKSTATVGRRLRVELVLRDRRGTLSNRPSVLLEFQP